MAKLTLKSADELRRMTPRQRNIYKTQLVDRVHELQAEARIAAWSEINRAIERSNTSQAITVVKHGGLTVGTIMLEYFAGDRIEDALVLITVDRRNGKPVEKFMPEPDMVFAYLRQLGIDPYNMGGKWEPV